MSEDQMKEAFEAWTVCLEGHLQAHVYYSEHEALGAAEEMNAGWKNYPAKVVKVRVTLEVIPE